MKVEELQIGAVFRVVGETELWQKTDAQRAVKVRLPSSRGVDTKRFGKQKVEIVEWTAPPEIQREGDSLFLRGGDVELEFLGPWSVVRCTPAKTYTEFALAASTLDTSTVEKPTADTALPFQLASGSSHLGRPGGSMIFAYKGRVYARATKLEVNGERGKGGYKTTRVIDGVTRLIIAGVLTLPGESALYDIIEEHFGQAAST